MARVLGALALVAVITFVFFRLIPVNATTAGFFYLVAILMIATAWGIVESTIASIVATLCFNFFFLPPVGTFTISDPQNFVALFAFLATSLTAGQLSDRLKHQRTEALNKGREMERLYALSRAILLTDSTEPTGKQIARQIAQAFDCPAAALFDRKTGEVYLAGPEALPQDMEARLRGVTIQSTVIRDRANGIVITPVRLGGEPIGSLAVKNASMSDAALQSVVSLAAVGLERARAQEEVNRAQIARQGEELKSTLLDAIAHEFKTPITSIKAVTSDLLSDPNDPLSAHQHGSLAIADEEADRLARLVTEAIQLARVQAGSLRLQRGVHFPSSLIAAALRQTKTLTDGREIRVDAMDSLPPLSLDSALIQMVIAHLIENAVKYTPSGSPISIGARAGQDGVVFYVADQGPGISGEQQTRIFEKFYRGHEGQSLSKGTGMGLAIAREIVRAHGGEIWVSSTSGQGSEFFFSLPVAREGSNS